MLKTRIITAIVMISVLLLALLALPPLGWRLFVDLITALAAWEWGKLMKWPAKKPALFAVFVFIVCAEVDIMTIYAGFNGLDGFIPPFITTAIDDHKTLILTLTLLPATLFWLLFAPLWLRYGWTLFRRPNTAAILGIMLLCTAGFALGRLRGDSPAGFSDGALSVLTVLAIVWIADTAAYFSGKAFGRHKLAPRISPGKTWEGVAGAAVAVLLYGILLEYWQPTALWAKPLLPLPFVLLLTMAVSIVGDLFMSMLKRQVGVKDSSNLLPGHGGILDRIDSLIAALPVLLLLLVSI